MKRILIIAVLLCHALSGCSWMDGSYHYVAPHDVSAESDNDSIVTAGNFGEIRAAVLGKEWNPPSPANRVNMALEALRS